VQTQQDDGLVAPLGGDVTVFWLCELRDEDEPFFGRAWECVKLSRLDLACCGPSHSEAPMRGSLSAMPSVA